MGRPREHDERTAAAARLALGDERYDQALAAGRALPLPRAVDEAIAKVGEASQLRLADTTS